MLVKSRRVLLFLILTAGGALAQRNLDETQLRERAQQRWQRQQEFYRLRAFPGNSIPPGARAAAIEEMNRMAAAEKAGRGDAPAGSAWTLIGPRPTNTLTESSGSVGYPYSAGRVAAMAVDPRNANVAYLGAAGGGVWKTSDGGQTWTPITDDQPSLAIGSITIAPSNPDVVYVGTGEQNNSGDSYYGAGILKTSDGGVSWSQIKGPFVGPFTSSRTSGGGARIGAIAVSPSNANLVLAAVDRGPTSQAGIYRSTDGGANWTLPLGGTVGSDVVYNPVDPTIVYAALGSTFGNARNGVYKSTDAGVTWALASGTIPVAASGRIVLAIAPSSPNTVFASIENAANSALLGLYRTTDAAQSWTRLNTPDYCNPQCDYNNVVRVSPANANIVIAAGLPPYRSLDGGVTWANIATGSDGLTAHTDHHALAFSADGARLYTGNDGGAFSSTTFATSTPRWNNLNATLAITEFSSNVSIDPADPRIAYAGTQDNGTLRYSGSLVWDQISSGDGGFTAIDSAVPNIWYGTLENFIIFKQSGITSLSDLLNPYTATWPYLVNGINTTDRGQFYVPLIMDASNPTRLFYGTHRLYLSNDGAGTWTAISPDVTGGAGSITAIAVSPANPRVVAVGANTGRMEISSNAGSTGTTWSDATAGLAGRGISQVAFDPIDPATLYAGITGFSGLTSFIGSGVSLDDSGHIFKSSDTGKTWTNITGNLPNVPVNDIVVDPDVAGVVYVATDIGVFQTTDGGKSWVTLSAGLPKVLVRALNLHRASRTLRAVTYGRSMWDLAVPLSSKSLWPHIDSATLANAVLTLTGSNFTAASVVRWNGSDRTAGLVNGNTLRIGLTADDLARAGRGVAVVFNPSAGGGLSNAVNVAVGGPPEVSTGGVTSAAALVAGSPLVPGSISSIYGRNLAPDIAVPGAAPLPYTLGGAILEVNGIPAPLFFVSPGQINFQVPWDLEGHNRATLILTNGTQSSAPLLVDVAVAAPAIFTINGVGTGQGAVTISGTGALAAPTGAFRGSRPVRRGEFIEIYATGLGPVSRLQSNGTPKPATTAAALSRVPDVSVGGIPATVQFSGLAPGGVGLYQVNVQVPAGAPLGDAVRISMSIGTAFSNTVTIAVQQ